mmetsp:Transcript_35746/g.77255  ORF Transcript_35746/g.77255 Transcript_35746/m.77255 type:complete len:476 (-) Transcript_35746:310-1737(-)
MPLDDAFCSSAYDFGAASAQSSSSSKRRCGAVYSDRHVPSRAGSNLATGLGLLEGGLGGDAPGGSQENVPANENGGLSLHHQLIRNEVLGLSGALPTSDVFQASDNRERTSTNLFRFTPDHRVALHDPFSLAPVPFHSGELINTPRKVPRKISKVPFKVLDAPQLQDDFYLNLVDWSSTNTLCVGLCNCVYLWNACTSRVTKLCDLSGDDVVTSVNWTQRGAHLAVGTNKGEVEIWDASQCRKLRTMMGHRGRVGTMAWNGPVLSTGSRDHHILHRDVRQEQHYFAKLPGHRQEVCGLKWSYDEQQLASGGNDNKLCVWDIRSLQAGLKFHEHQAAVKAISWSPHQRGLLASGGGTADRCIRFWNTVNDTPSHFVDTGSQVCNLIWSRNVNEIVSTHGYSLNQIVVWKYPSMTEVITLTGHTYRVLYLAISPDGQTIVTGAGDETLRFWNVFPSTKSSSCSLLNSSSLPFGRTIR